MRLVELIGFCVCFKAYSWRLRALFTIQNEKHKIEGVPSKEEKKGTRVCECVCEAEVAAAAAVKVSVE